MGKKLVYGVGINDADYRVDYMDGGKRVVCPSYTRWKNILRRCYSNSTLNGSTDPTYKGCTVSESWLTFSNFKRWIGSHRGFSNLHVDKDLRGDGSKIYSESTCLMVTRDVNNFLEGFASKRGMGLTGVSFSKNMNAYESRVTEKGTVKALSYHDCPVEAHRVWLDEKLKIGYKMACDLPKEVKGYFIKTLEELPLKSNKLIEDYLYEETK